MRVRGRVRAAASRAGGGQGRGWEQGGCVVSEASGKELPEEAESARRAERELLAACQASPVALASSPLPAWLWWEVVLPRQSPFRRVRGTRVWECWPLSPPGCALVAGAPAEPRGCVRGRVGDGHRLPGVPGRALRRHSPGAGGSPRDSRVPTSLSQRGKQADTFPGLCQPPDRVVQDCGFRRL